MDGKSFNEFKPDYKAELKWDYCLKKQFENFSTEGKQELSKAFEEIVTWCINGNTEKLKEAASAELDYHTNYKIVLFSDSEFIDVKSDCNIIDIMVATDNIEAMKVITDHSKVNQKSLNFG